MPVQTRFMTKTASPANVAVPEANIAENLYLYKDEEGIEYITQEHIQMRGISNKTCDDYALYLYRKISDIHPRYRKSCPENVAKRDDVFALAPKGYAWEEEDSGTSYFHWDEWYILVKFNKYLKHKK